MGLIGKPQTRVYVIAGIAYVVTRTEDWNNDETQVTFVLEGPGYCDHVSSDYGEDDEFPTDLEIRVHLAGDNVYTLTARETLTRELRETERALERAQSRRDWALRAAETADAAVATATEKARQTAATQRRGAEQYAQAAVTHEVRVAELVVQLQNLKD